ncbi:MAG: hypothetical protein AAF631_06395 [Pseudomonadota bacterium]
MAYDYQLVGGAIVAILGMVAAANALVEKRRPYVGLGGAAMGCGLLAWAWLLADGFLGPRDLAAAVYRILAAWT